MRNPFGHVDLRVSSMADALALYEQLLPALGFTERYDGPEWKVFGTGGEFPSAAYFGLVEAADHVPNANRVAFWVDGPEEVDRIAALLRSSGAADLSGPKRMPYGPDYYAVFFEDPSGNPLEVYYRRLG